MLPAVVDFLGSQPSLGGRVHVCTLIIAFEFLVGGVPGQELLALIEIVEFVLGGGLGGEASVVRTGGIGDDETAPWPEAFVVLPARTDAHYILVHINKIKISQQSFKLYPHFV
jgi:hypothetical protein